MRALLLFHLRVGTRVAVRSFTPLFAGLLCLIILQMYPVAFVTSIALRVYADRPALVDRMIIIVFALALSFWAVPQLLVGLNGWVRHLPISHTRNRRGLVLGLLASQLPLAVSLLLLAAVARARGLGVALPLARYLVVLVACAFAAVPVRRQFLTAPVGIAVAVLALSVNLWLLLPAPLVLLVMDAVAGPIRGHRRRRGWRPAESFLSFRISWRALGWDPVRCYFLSIIPIVAAALFLSNNELTGSYRGGVARFGGSLAVLVLISGLARQLALRRPPWPLARSFPWSAAHRVGGDALFLGLHALPIVMLVYWLDPRAIPATAALIPILSVRAAGSMRKMPSRRTGSGSFIAEGFVVSALCALVAYSSILWLAASPLAFGFARRAERNQKVTRWLELHYAAAGDSLSWSD